MENTLNLLPTDEVTVKLKFEKMFKVEWSSNIVNTIYKGPLLKVLERIALNLAYSYQDDEETVDSLIDIFCNQTEGCEYIVKLEILEPKQIVLIDNEVTEEKIIIVK